MAKTPENIQLKRDRRYLINVLNLCYPGHMDGEEIYRTVLDMNPEYTRKLCVKDLAYLHEEGYVTYRGRECDARTISVKDCQFRLTSQGTKLAHQLIDDPAISF